MSADEFQKKYKDAFLRKDREEIERLINSFYQGCNSKSSACLHEIYCPDCPFGGFMVKSARS